MKEKGSNRKTYCCSVFPLKVHQKIDPMSLQCLSLYRAPNKVKYQHTLKKTLYKEGKSGKKIKQYQKVKKNGIEKILCFFSFSTSAPSFLLIMIRNVEFDSNSSCLDRIDNLGINSLQKLQN